MIKNDEEARKFIQKANWKYSEEYKNSFPHSYTKKTEENKEEFEAFIKYIRKKGVLKSFYYKQYLYLELDGEEYWEMGRPTKAVLILNRAKINDEAPYRRYKPTKQEETIIKKKLEERDKHINSLIQKKNRTINEEYALKRLLDNRRKKGEKLDHNQKRLDENHLII